MKQKLSTKDRYENAMEDLGDVAVWIMAILVIFIVIGLILKAIF